MRSRAAFSWVTRRLKGAVKIPLITTNRFNDPATIEAVRSLGMAARFVSGYLHVPDHNDDGNAGGGNTHAWVQVYLPGPGWVDFDPTNGIVPIGEHITRPSFFTPSALVVLSQASHSARNFLFAGDLMLWK